MQPPSAPSQLKFRIAKIEIFRYDLVPYYRHKWSYHAKKYIVRLSIEERGVLEDVIKKLKGSSEKVRRAHILLKADADGPNWTDAKIAEAFWCRRRLLK